ncbi:MAG: NADH-quinone oxidoreductase subunit J [Xanthomonadales bacterium]|nr:NADH-quinone oxidoreductase subunit J [Xanthomonadales bacterium]
MTIQEIFFYLFSIIMLAAATMVISVRNPVYAILYLILTFFSAAALWILLEAEFLGIILVLVYVGAVMVLFLFVVMMLNISQSRVSEGFVKNLPLGIGVALVMLAEVLMVLWYKNQTGIDNYPIPVPHEQGYSNTAEIGERLFTAYLWQFEIAGVVLLVAIVAAVALSMREREGVKSQSVPQQISADKRDRLELVDMPVEGVEKN